LPRPWKEAALSGRSRSRLLLIAPRKAGGKGGRSKAASPGKNVPARNGEGIKKSTGDRGKKGVERKLKKSFSENLGGPSH